MLPSRRHRSHRPVWLTHDCEQRSTSVDSHAAVPAGIWACTWRTVRGEIWMPSLSNSSLAMRSSPQDGLSRTMARMSARNSAGIRGRPGRDFQRQNRRNPAPCQPMKVFGVTFTSVSCHAKPCESSTSIKRVTLLKRRGLILCSW